MQLLQGKAILSGSGHEEDEHPVVSGFDEVGGWT